MKFVHDFPRASRGWVAENQVYYYGRDQNGEPYQYTVVIYHQFSTLPGYRLVADTDIPEIVLKSIVTLLVENILS